MRDEHLLKEFIEKHTIFKYIGPGHIMGIPARDLIEADLAEIEEREGITRQVIEASGLYEPVDVAEVEPFCGAPIGNGGRCSRKVQQWGERCYQHKEED